MKVLRASPAVFKELNIVFPNFAKGSNIAFKLNFNKPLRPFNAPSNVLGNKNNDLIPQKRASIPALALPNIFLARSANLRKLTTRVPIIILERNFHTVPKKPAFLSGFSTPLTGVSCGCFDSNNSSLAAFFCFSNCLRKTFC